MFRCMAAKPPAALLFSPTHQSRLRVAIALGLTLLHRGRQGTLKAHRWPQRGPAHRRRGGPGRAHPARVRRATLTGGLWQILGAGRAVPYSKTTGTVEVTPRLARPTADGSTPRCG